jgi:hypothetical protein
MALLMSAAASLHLGRKDPKHTKYTGIPHGMLGPVQAPPKVGLPWSEAIQEHAELHNSMLETPEMVILPPALPKLTLGRTEIVLILTLKVIRSFSRHTAPPRGFLFLILRPLGLRILPETSSSNWAVLQASPRATSLI